MAVCRWVHDRSAGKAQTGWVILNTVIPLVILMVTMVRCRITEASRSVLL